MRHAVFGKKLNRDIGARRALLFNLASSLFESGQITTSLAKAKFAQSHSEKLITLGKSKNIGTRRRLASQLSKMAFEKIISEIGPGFLNRPGGYTRITKLKNRRGDSALLARLELLKFEKSPKKPTAGPTRQKVEDTQKAASSTVTQLEESDSKNKKLK